MPDETHAKLFEKDGIIKNLQSEMLELKLKVKSVESTVLETKIESPHKNDTEKLRNVLSKLRDENHKLT